MKKYISLQQAADIANVSRQTIANWVDERIISSRKTRCSTGHKYEVHIDSLMNIVNNSTIVANTQAITAYEAQAQLKVAEMAQEWKALLTTQEAIARYPHVRHIFIQVLQAIVNNNNNLRGVEMIIDMLKGRTLSEVGNRFGITTERVRQIVFNTLLRCNKVFSWATAVEENQKLTNEVEQLQHKVKQLEAENYNLRKDKEDLLINQKIEENIANERNEELITLYATSIKDTDLPKRVKVLLTCARVYTIRDLLHRDTFELLRVRNFGRKALIIIEDWLEKYNLEIGQLKRKY